MSNHFRWLDVIDYKFGGGVVDPKGELDEKYPHVFILGKLRRGDTVNLGTSPSKRGER